ncbi:helix-turn-helix domain-containing protein [Natrarchaeobius chitinivorans]|uniref:Winged helix-turn-helix transcriptional regulator n=1 Tax=Natrarchaeobius chitinivorans TaxID=1679083 RepID=A0A3N6MKJ1_NATCH|nr:helix-turn-helix domain-containing protein [Natrarchaeobius chitinivorans]RQG96461.1 winged helix-turn-helix transcriptional regulator [Natrarchaeobius chitinivorans]
MRDATVTLTWADGRINSVDDSFARSDEVSIEAIRHLNPAGDRRCAELLEFRGDLDTARRLLADSPDALEYDVAGENGRGLAYVQCLIDGSATDLLAILRDYEIVVDWPITYVDRDAGNRGLEIRVLGSDRAIQRAAASLPAGIEFDLRRLSGFEFGTDRAPVLTDRQRQIFELAHDEGYYAVPRETTHRELADRLGISPGTVGEHLQRIEVKLARRYRHTSPERQPAEVNR